MRIRERQRGSLCLRPLFIRVLIGQRVRFPKHIPIVSTLSKLESVGLVYFSDWVQMLATSFPLSLLCFSFPAKLRMGHDGFDSGSKRVFMGFGDLVNGINVWPISECDFAAMSVTDKFANDAFENGFLIGH